MTAGFFTLLYGNLTQYGPQAQGFLFAESQYDMLCLLEMHVPESDTLEVISRFAKHHYECKGSLNPARPTGLGGNHGGELVAAKKHLDSSPVDPHVLSQIQLASTTPLSLAARFSRLQHVTILIIMVYLFSRRA